MHKSIQLGLLAGVIISLTACGGSSGGGSSKPSSSSLSSQVVSSDGPSSVAESSSSEASESSSVESSSAPSSSSAESSSVVSSSVESSVPSSSSSSLSSSSASSEGPVLTGVFLDNVVAGIAYSNSPSGKSGVTTSLGEYEYVEGDTVTFSIGDLALPPVPAKGVVTPADIAQAAHINDSTAATVTKTNILQLLQTLDNDNDPSNGIQLPSTAAAIFTGVNVPDVTTADFDTAVAAALPEGVSLVSEEQAVAHFENTLQSLLLGSWVYSEGEGKRNVLTFVSDNRYIIIHEHDDNESQLSGSVEYGSYEWDLEAKELRIQVIGESDAYGGLYDADAAEGGVVTHTIEVDGTTLTLGTPLDGQARFIRVTSSGNPIIGGWALYEEGNNLNVLTFLSETEYVIAHTNNQESYSGQPNQPLSGEFGTYTLTGTQFQVTGATIDTDGEGGLYNREDPSDQLNETMEITPWGDLLFGEDNEGTFSFSRLGSFAAHLQDYDEDGALGTISATRDPAGFNREDIAGKNFYIELPYADGSKGSFSFEFGSDLDEDDRGTGVITATVEDEEEEDVIVDITWTINSTGVVMAWFNDDGESFTLAIAKLIGSSTNGEPKVLLSLQSEEETSLWESRMQHSVE
jgi:hypothetical protein